MILSAQSILARHLHAPLIDPFHERTVFKGMTFGLGPAGYDVRIAETFLLPPKDFRLASTIEHFRVPDDITFKVEDKSSWARRGLSLFNTTAEPGWRGFLTLELVNHSSEPIAFEAGMPIAQIVFHHLDRPTSKPYAGKYQDQCAGAVQAIDELARPATSAAHRTLRPAQNTGDSCRVCGNFTLIRSGTCLTCQTCGETTGCS